jgi:hypothetical protein
MQDGERRLLVERQGTVTDAELIAVVEALDPFPLTDAASAPVLPDRHRGTVSDVLNKVEGAVTVTGWVVIEPSGKVRICESLNEKGTPPCGYPFINVEVNNGPQFVWKPPPTRQLGVYQVSETPVEIAGSLKGDLLFPGVL